MAILFTDGFDSYGTTTGTNILTRWTNASNPGSIISATTPYGIGQSINAGFGNIASSTTTAFTASATVTIGACINASGGPGAASAPDSYQMFYFLSSGTYMMGLSIAGNGNIVVSRMTGQLSGTQLAITSSPVIKFNAWHYIEFSITISDTVGTVRVDVDGRTVINQTGLDTRNGTPTTVNTLTLGTNNNYTVYVDDLYITDSITPLGPQRIYTLKPNADTAQKQWSPLSGVNNYSMVSETVTDGDTSYVQASTVGNFDLYDVANLTPSSATISAVNHLVWAKKTDVTVRTMNLTTKSGTTTTDSAAVTLSTSYVGYNKLYETDPNTATAWSVSGVNALQIGQKVAS